MNYRLAKKKNQQHGQKYKQTFIQTNVTISN